MCGTMEHLQRCQVAAKIASSTCRCVHAAINKRPGGGGGGGGGGRGGVIFII